MADRRPTTPNVHVATDAQPHAPTVNAPVPSESLGSLARRLILDLGTHVHELDMAANGRGGLKVTITLETADIV